MSLSHKQYVSCIMFNLKAFLCVWDKNCFQACSYGKALSDPEAIEKQRRSWLWHNIYNIMHRLTETYGFGFKS